MTKFSILFALRTPLFGIFPLQHSIVICNCEMSVDSFNNRFDDFDNVVGIGGSDTDNYK